MTNESAYPDALPASYRLHWYVIERVLGQGGFGITYLARDTNLDQPVAIKEFLPAEVASRRPDAAVRARTAEHDERYRSGLDRFIREARTLARFDHPNIVRVHSVFEHNGTAYMVMRFEEGETLAACLERRHALPEADLMRVLLPVLDGLELVHAAGFIHRDIKPDNIHLRPDGTPVLLDFGSARYALGQPRTMTILVAPGYAPFEQYYSSAESQGPWTDIYSLAATCYRAIAGRPPMDAIARSKGILGSAKEVMLPASVVGAGRYSEPLLKAIDHGLAFSEQQRPQSIADWRKVLRGAEPAAPAAAASQAASPAASPAAAPRRSAFVAPLLWASAGAALLALVLFLPQLMRPAANTPPPAAAPAIAAAPAPVAPQSDDATRKRLEALETQLAEERRRREAAERAEVERKRVVERPRPAPVASPPAKKPAPTREEAKPQPVPVPVATVAVAPQPGPAPAPAPVPAPAPPAVKPEPRPADPMALAEAARARGDDAEMVAQYRRAAAQGNAEANFRLGDVYASGRGQPQNNLQAYVYFSLAALGGHAGAGQRRDALTSLLQPAEIQQADRLVRERRRSSNERKS
jgi:hypothetical protein